MNKAFCKKRVFLSFLLTGCLILFNISCGLDTFYVLPGPITTEHKPDYLSEEYAENHFDFWTVETGCDGVRFNGTDVYYKIYTNKDTLKNQRTSLDTLITSETASPFDSLISSSYNYKRLTVEGHEDESTLIPASATKSNQLVSIRLSDFTDQYLAEILVNGQNIYGESNRVIPLRYVTDDNGKAVNFNFKLTDSNSLPKSSQEDVNSTGGNSEENVWYVCLYAVAVGNEPSYALVHSNLLYLGSVKIPAQ